VFGPFRFRYPLSNLTLPLILVHHCIGSPNTTSRLCQSFFFLIHITRRCKMLPQNKLRFTTLVVAWMLLSLSPSADAFHGNSRGLSSPSRLPATVSKSSHSRSISVRSQIVEDDFRQPYGDVVDESGMLSKIASRLSNLVSFDKKRVAKFGVSFMITYNLISNINGSIFLSLAWYITSLRVSS
jgi:hypothetical protein